jgi:hypothetical protein
MHLGFRHVREISALEKAERGNIFTADTRSAGPLCVIRFFRLKHQSLYACFVDLSKAYDHGTNY